MSYTNKTKTLELPQYVADDKPTWLEDINNTFEKIDNFAENVNTEIDSAKIGIENNANAVESINETIENQRVINGNFERQINTNKENLSLLTTHVNEHDTEIRELGSAIENLVVNDSDFEIVTPVYLDTVPCGGSATGKRLITGFRIKNILILTFTVSDYLVTRGGGAGMSAFPLSSLITSTKYKSIKQPKQAKVCDFSTGKQYSSVWTNFNGDATKINWTMGATDSTVEAFSMSMTAIFELLEE